ncbi:uncharacterized protein LOC121983314 [Zingiber officinale]|uniref:VQ domain-containing protein n=1 Tax=Zingiber officinale TaxID=94328 RepID=A0A8J5GRH6_ZINOF|nr:uncharacterized protein LOC121983314 [Zingiber officinale]KAG6508743.1 hypothetical protein ZIOFF_034124 [Zingiber officinale]
MVMRGSKAGAGGRSPPKVVVIETRHVRTDAKHFKAVVQSLTGKDSTLEAVVPEKPDISYVGGFIGGRCSNAFGVARWPAEAKYLPLLQPPVVLLPPPSALTLKESESSNSALEILLDDGCYMLRQHYSSDYFY